MCSHHAAHATHAAHASHATGVGRVVRAIDDHGLGRDHQRCDAGSVDECNPDDFSRVHNSGGLHVNIFTRGRIEASADVVSLDQLVDDDGALETSVLADSLSWDTAGLSDDVNTNVLVEVGSLKTIKFLSSVQKSGSTTDDATLLRGSTSSAKSILDTVLELTDLDLGRSTDLDDGDATSKSAHTLLKLFLVIIASSCVHLFKKSINALINISLGASTTHKNNVILGDDDSLGTSEHANISVIDGLANILGEEGGTSGDSDILHGVASVVTEAGGFDGGDLKSTAELVHDEGGESLALNILSDEEEGSLLFHASLQEGEDLLHGGDFFVNKEDSCVGELNLGGLGVSHEVGGDVPTVPLKTLDILHFGLKGLAFRHSDGTVRSEPIEDARNEAADVSVTVSRDGGDVADILRANDRDGLFLEANHDGVNGHLDTTSQVHWVHAGGDRLAALLEDGTGKDGGGGGAITSFVVSLGGDLLDEVSANVVVAVAELNVFSDSDTVLGNLRHAKSPVEDDIASTGSEGDLDCVGEHVAALKHESARFSSEFDLLTGEVHALSSHKLGSRAAQDSSLESFADSRLHHVKCVVFRRIK